MNNIDISRKFNGIPLSGRQALQKLCKSYDSRRLYIYEPRTLLNILGNDSDEVSMQIKLLIEFGFIYKMHAGYRLDRNKADTLITMGVLDLDPQVLEIKPMFSANEDPEDSEEKLPEMSIEPSLKKNKETPLLDLQLPIHEDYIFEDEIDPTKFSHDGFEIKMDSEGKNRRFNLIEIMDSSNAGHKIEPPIWLVSDTDAKKLYVIAQNGLRFTEPDRSIYVGLKQLEFIKANPHFILGVFANTDTGRTNAKEHASKFFDVTLNGKSLGGFLPHRVGEKFWMLQSAKDGLYIVLKKGILPPFILNSRKITDMTYDEAIGVFIASEKKAAEPKSEEPEDITSKYEGLDNFNLNLDNTLEGFN